MRLAHFEALAPLCPRCRAERRADTRVVLGPHRVADDGVVEEGALHCPAPACRHEFPILDGIPLLLPDPARYMAESQAQLLAREDLPDATLSLLGDAIGPGTPFEAARHHLGAYAHDHWGEFGTASAGTFPPGSVARALHAGLALLGEGMPDGPTLDIGCATGRATAELAATGAGLVLGIDLNFAMLRLASRAMRRGRLRYPLRRIGLVYDMVEVAVPRPHAARTDHWVCDALAPPFAPGRFARIAALNVLDCVAAPVNLLQALASLLAPGGGAVLATPYDWSPAATQPPYWIGGHSQRGPDAGAAEPLLRALLTPGQHPQSIPDLRIAGELLDHPWTVRLHARSTMVYALHMLGLRKAG